MIQTVAIVVLGRCPHGEPLVGALVEHLADRLRGTDGAKLPLRLPDGTQAERPIDLETIRVGQLATGQDAILFEIPVEDGDIAGPAGLALAEEVSAAAGELLGDEPSARAPGDASQLPAAATDPWSQG